jgi:TolB-like protein
MSVSKLFPYIAGCALLAGAAELATIPVDSQLQLEKTGIQTGQQDSSVHSLSMASESIQPDTIAAAKNPLVLIAVSDFASIGIDSVSALVLSDRFRNEFPQDPKVKVLRRNEMLLTLERQGYKRDRVCDYDSCLIHIGKLLGAQYVVTGTVSRIENVTSLNIRMLNPLTGATVCAGAKDAKIPLTEALSGLVPQLARQFYNEITKYTTAFVEVQTTPQGASIKIQSKDAGITPITLKGLEEGHYILEIFKDTYEPVVDTLILVKGALVKKSYSLNHAAEFLKQRELHKRKVGYRLLQGTILTGAVGALAGGIYYNGKLRDIADRQNSISSSYAAGNETTDFVTLKSRYDHLTASYDRRENYRNAAYIAAAILAGGFSITLFF